MKRYLRDITCIFILLCLVVGFFLRLFYPTPQLLVTPDFGRSDAWHFSMPTKFVLSQSLNSGELPLWRSDAGTGFPLFAEGQTGALFLPNLILFSLLEWTTAYNLSLAFCVFTLGAGMYFLLRVLGAHPTASLFGAVTIAFSGLSILQLSHITLLQAMSLMPIVLGVGILCTRKNTFFYYAPLSILITQQMFAGFPQAVFLTMCVLFAYGVYDALQKKHVAPLVFLSIAALVGLIGSSAQLLPSYEFLKASTHPTGFDQPTASMFSMPLSHLISYINPFAFGNAQLGTYPPFYRFDASMFWENTAYLGLFPLLFALVWLIQKKQADRWFYLSLLLGSILLAWGKHSPMYLLYGVWPLTLFRAPSRFLWITSITIAIIASLQVSHWEKVATHRRKLLIGTILLLQTILLFSTWWSYNLLVPTATLLTKPPQVPEKSVRFTTLGEPLVHNQVFTTTGWSTASAYTTTYRALSPLSNMFFDASAYGIYAGRFLKRQALYNDILDQSLALSPTEATVSASALSLLSGSSVKEIHSFLPIHNDDLILKETITEKPPLYIYENPLALPQAYLAYEATTAATVNQAAAILGDPDFATKRSVLLSQIDGQDIGEVKKAIGAMKYLPKNVSITINRPTHTKTVIHMPALTVPSLLILSDTYYPQWRVTVNGKEATIYPANLTYRAVVVPTGGTEIVFSYEPPNIKLGIQISLFVHAAIGILAVCHLFLVRLRTENKAQLPD